MSSSCSRMGEMARDGGGSSDASIAGSERARSEFVGRSCIECITDVDAIGARGETLRIVSCKSVVHTNEHDRGSHRDVRNAASLVAKAVKDRRDETTAPTSAPGYTSRCDRDHFLGLSCCCSDSFATVTRSTSVTAERSSMLRVPNIAPSSVAATELKPPELLEWPFDCGARTVVP